MNHTGARFAKWGMLPLRIVVGLVFLMHGGQKLFVFGPAGTADIMGKLGLPLPSYLRGDRHHGRIARRIGNPSRSVCSTGWRSARPRDGGCHTRRAFGWRLLRAIWLRIRVHAARRVSYVRSEWTGSSVARRDMAPISDGLTPAILIRGASEQP